MTLFRPKLPKLEKPPLLSSLPEIRDTFLVNKSLPDIVEREKHPQSSPIYHKLAESGLLEATTFPAAITYPELILECANHYDPILRCIKKASGEVILKINRTSINSAYRIPHREPYEPWTFEEAERLYAEMKNSYDNKIAQSWLLKPVEGGSRLPKPLTIDHFMKEISNIVLLLNRVKGNEHAFHWESWMYFFIQKIVEGVKFIDWSDLIAESLHTGLIAVKNCASFFLFDIHLGSF